MLFRLDYPMKPRLAWGVTALLCAAGGSASAIGSLAGHRLGSLLTGGLAVVYLWLAVGALRAGTAREASLRVDDDRLVVVHDGLLTEPLVVDRSAVREVVVDTRTGDERRTAAVARGGGVTRSNFLASVNPVVDASPSAHWAPGGAATPNVVVLFTEPVPPPEIRKSVRLLTRIFAGQAGRYRGPRPKSKMPGIRLVVEDAEGVAAAFGRWGILTMPARDERYLAPVVTRDRDAALKHRVVVGGVVVAAVAFVFGTRAAR